jgi:hypothetical protein
VAEGEIERGDIHNRPKKTTGLIVFGFSSCTRIGNKKTQAFLSADRQRPFDSFGSSQKNKYNKINN